MKVYRMITLLLLACSFALFVSCEDDNPEPTLEAGVVDLKFDNVVGPGVNAILSPVLSTQYPYQNPMGQEFNVTLLKYLVSRIVLEGPNGARFEDELKVTADEALGYYVIDLSSLASRILRFDEVPAGTYNKVTFMVGVDSSGVAQGAAGGVLSQGMGNRDTDMFWNWNAGYVSVKFEGQTAANTQGAAFGETITEDNLNGFAYHLGGWGNPNNNKTISIETDPFTVAEGQEPSVHIVLDLAELLKGINMSLTFSLHSPASGVNMANNIPAAFKFDHVHQ